MVGCSVKSCKTYYEQNNPGVSFHRMWWTWGYVQVVILMPLIKFIQIVTVVVTSLIFSRDYYLNNADVTDGQTFDFIIVGAGSAGCVLANRLTEVENWSVLLVEAGDDPPYATDIPGLSVLLGYAFPGWGYYTVDDKYASQAQKTRNIHMIQGKMLGGSSNNNYMYYVRGNKEDYNNWYARGNTGWDWDTVRYYFKKSENLNDPELLNSDSRSLHGTNGYLGITKPKWEKQIKTKAIFEALKENGHDIIDDINGYQQLGYSLSSYNINNARRQSGSLAFLKPIVTRKNFFILKNTLAKKIILDNNEAVGVKLKESSGAITNVYAKKEIIISAGSINSPQLLMLSGIGSKKHLEEHGIETIIDLPNVGGNLQDHMLVPIIISGGNNASLIDNLEPLAHLDKFPVPTIMGHVALDKNQLYPDYQVTSFTLPVGSILHTLMCSEIFRWNNDICISMAKSARQDVLFALISYLHPESRGTIRLRNNNSDDAPLIYSKYFSNYGDTKKFAECIKDFTSILNTTYFKSVGAEIEDLNVEQCRGLKFNSPEYWECYVLNMATSQFHCSGTCAMGPEKEGVVDERLRVRGVKNLRVVDASIMPTIVSGNTNAAVIMIAEKASDMIKTDNIVEESGFLNEINTWHSEQCEQKYQVQELFVNKCYK